jgi:hypothetical protein
MLRARTIGCSGERYNEKVQERCDDSSDALFCNIPDADIVSKRWIASGSVWRPQTASGDESATKERQCYNAESCLAAIRK